MCIYPYICVYIDFVNLLYTFACIYVYIYICNVYVYIYIYMCTSIYRSKLRTFAEKPGKWKLPSRKLKSAIEITMYKMTILLACLHQLFTNAEENELISAE